MNYKLILLPTEETSHIYKIKDTLLLEKYPVKSITAGNQLLILLSDESPKEYEPSYSMKLNRIEKVLSNLGWQEAYPKDLQKIISTSSKELTSNSIISLDKQKEIVEYYNENGVLPAIDAISFKEWNQNETKVLNKGIQFDIVKQTKMGGISVEYKVMDLTSDISLLNENIINQFAIDTYGKNDLSPLENNVLDDYNRFLNHNYNIQKNKLL